MEQPTHHTATEPARRGESASRRSIDPLALFAGIVFVIVAVIGLTDRIVLSFGDLRWIGPILLIAFGIVLVATAAGGRRRNGQTEGGPTTSTSPSAPGAADPGEEAGTTEALEAPDEER